MKDEEIAEEWWNNWVVKDWNDLQEGKKLFIQAFLAGLNVGRSQWHNLKKDPNDLPKFRRNILVTCEYRSKLKKKRETFEWDYNSEMPLHAIAWCEIPTFDKE